jgi:hypothetical protein
LNGNTACAQSVNKIIDGAARANANDTACLHVLERGFGSHFFEVILSHESLSVEEED